VFPLINPNQPPLLTNRAFIANLTKPDPTNPHPKNASPASLPCRACFPLLNLVGHVSPSFIPLPNPAG